MEVEKGKTYKYLRDKKGISQEAKDKLKEFTKIKKTILGQLKEKELSIEELTQKLPIPKHEVVYYLQSLVKFGFVEKSAIDDMDEYFTYKLKK